MKAQRLTPTDLGGYVVLVLWSKTQKPVAADVSPRKLLWDPGITGESGFRMRRLTFGPR